MPKVEDQMNSTQDEKLDKEFNVTIFCEQVSRTIGGKVTPERIENLIRISNEGKHVFHGIKRAKLIEKIESEGIKPLAPEGGGASYWTSGQRLFGELKSDGTLQTYDSTFFHYGHTESNSGSNDEVLMTIAISNSEALNQISKVDIKDNDYLEIRFHVPRDKIFIIKIKMSRKILEGKTHREMGMAIEQKMFEEIEKALKEGYQLGGGVTIEI